GVRGGWGEQGVLEVGPGGLEDGKRAAEVVLGTAAGHAAQCEAGERGGLGSLRGMPSRELPDPSSPADQDVHDAVNVDDLDQPGGAERLEQLRDTEDGGALVRDTGGSQRTLGHDALRPSPVAFGPG